MKRVSMVGIRANGAFGGVRNANRNALTPNIGNTRQPVMDGGYNGYAALAKRA